MKKKVSVFDVIAVIFLLVIAVIFIYPLWTVFVAAFSEPVDYVKNPLALFPEHFTIRNFKLLLSTSVIWVGYKNTLIYVIIGTAINVCMTFVMAYGFCMKGLPYKRFFSLFVTLTLFFSGGMVPTYLVVKSYGLLDSIWALVLPGAIGTYNLLITRTYLQQQIPDELLEAAEIDGAGPLYTFWKIVTPLSKPILAVITLYYASSHWNGWYDAMVYLQDNGKKPLQLVLRSMLITEEMLTKNGTESVEQALYQITYNYAVIMIAILPLLMVFPFAQKFFVKGTMIGAIKG